MRMTRFVRSFYQKLASRAVSPGVQGSIAEQAWRRSNKQTLDAMWARRMFAPSTIRYMNDSGCYRFGAAISPVYINSIIVSIAARSSCRKVVIIVPHKR
jgi:hypothetical protein